MRIKSSIKIRCRKCFFVKRKKHFFVYCSILKHKQKQD